MKKESQTVTNCSQKDPKKLNVFLVWEAYPRIIGKMFSFLLGECRIVRTGKENQETVKNS